MAFRIRQEGVKKIPAGIRGLLIGILGASLSWAMLNLIFPFRTTIHYSPMVFDRKGDLLFTQLTPDEKWRLYLRPSDITPLMEKTILAKEDRWFYFHPGVNPAALARALFRNLMSGRRTSGASTISMQVARLLHPRKRTLGSKVIEMFRATQLEWQFSKKEILRLYLNLAPYGGNIEGIASAAHFYLNKSPDHLSLSQITALSVIPNRPNSLTPGRHNQVIIGERNRWLKWMEKRGLFDPKEVSYAMLEPFDAIRLPPPRLAPHLSLKLLGSGQPSIQSYIDLNTQLKAEKIVGNYIHALKLKGIHNASAIVLNNKTLEVLAYVGSANFFDSTDGGQVNGACAWRQPGSTLKPLAYGLAIDAGFLTPKKIMADVPVNYQGYVPENYDQRFNGLVTMEYALMHSLNIPAVNTLHKTGKDKMVQSLVQCGFGQIKRDQAKLGLSMVLGGCGANLEELTGLYAMLANEGSFSALHFYKGQKETAPVRILSREASFMLHETLSKIDRPDLPVNWGSTDNLPRIAWKTGTSYGRRDAWAIGYNKAFTIGVWVGNFSGAPNPELSGASIATPLLFRLFNTIDRQSHTDWYEPPGAIDQRIVCAETGMPVASHCNQRILDYFIPLVSAVEPCNNRTEVMVSPDLKVSYCPVCMPQGGFIKKWFTILPPEVQAFNLKNPNRQETIPPHNPQCTQVWADKGPVIQSPKHNSEYLLSRQHPEPILLECLPGADVAMVYWYINNKFYKAAPPRDRVFFMPTEGQVKVSCTDDKGRVRNVKIEVRMVDL